jgi:predicted nucleic acid-binding protein
MIYLDASYIAKCYLHEADSRKVLDLVQGSSGRSSALHGRAEFYSAVHRHLRERHISPRDAAAAWQQFERDERLGLWHWLALTERVVARACHAYEKLGAETFLRASDALHLACAAEHHFSEIYSSDRFLLGAAPQFGLIGISVH